MRGLESGIIADVAATPPTPTLRKETAAKSRELETPAAICNVRQGGNKRNKGKDKDGMKDSME